MSPFQAIKYMNTINSFDFETTGLRPHNGDRAFAYCIGYESGTVDVFQMNKKGIRNLTDFFMDTSIEKVGHGIKFDFSFLKYHNIPFPKATIFHDTLVQAQMLNNLSLKHDLGSTSWDLFGYPKDLDDEVSKLGKELGGYQNIPKHLMNNYQVADGQRTMIIHLGLFPEIREDALLYQDYLMEMQLIRVGMRMEEYGIDVHVDNCNKLINFLYEELDSINDELFELMGTRYNLSSETHVGKIIFDILRMEPLKKTKTGANSTDKFTINHLRATNPHPVLDMILKHRTYTKGTAMVSSYYELSSDKRILHPNILLNGAKKTGRKSVNNPNLQNVSKSKNLTNPFTVPARSCFKARKDCVLFLVDYRGIEMRLIVDTADCQPLRDIINVGGDVHRPAAVELYGEKFSNYKKCFEHMFKVDKKNKRVVTKYIVKLGKILGREEALLHFQKEMRGVAKNAHFAIAYGAGMKEIAKVLMLSLPEATEGFHRYANKYPEVAYFTKNTVQEVKEFGYVSNGYGRTLYVLKSKPYAGANYKIQGFASGLFKRAQIKMDTWLQNNYPDIRLVLDVHDEQIISYPKKYLKIKKIILKKLSRLMINIPRVNIRLDVEWKMTETTWDDAKEIEVEY